MKKFTTIILLSSLFLTACGGTDATDNLNEEQVQEQPTQPEVEQPILPETEIPTLPDTEVPMEVDENIAKPVGFDAEVDGYDITLSWNEVEGASSYLVFFNESKFVSTADNSLASKFNSIKVTAYQGTMNSYRVQAVTDNKVGELSSTIRVDLTQSHSTISDSSTEI